MKTYKVTLHLQVHDDDDSLDCLETVEDSVECAVVDFTSAEVIECYAEEVE